LLTIFIHASGPPDLFVTVAPADNGDIAVGVYAGYVSASNMSALDPAAWPTTVLRATFPPKNAWSACLRFEQKVCCIGGCVRVVCMYDIGWSQVETIIRELFGFDVGQSRPMKRGGIFGLVKAFTAGIEEQGMYQSIFVG
jgi:hypothetical protein